MRNPKLTPTKVMLRAIRLGLTQKLAANLAGLNQSEFDEKLANEPQFAKQVRVASAHYARRHIDRIDKHSEKVWTASAWLLERIYPGDYGPAHAQLAVHTNIESGPTNVVVLGPERAKVLATRYEGIRAKTLELLEHRNGDKNGE
jgi:hypothetical protein